MISLEELNLNLYEMTYLSDLIYLVEKSMYLLISLVLVFMFIRLVLNLLDVI